jgi:hypothetical protein
MALTLNEAIVGQLINLPTGSQRGGRGNKGKPISNQRVKSNLDNEEPATSRVSPK